MTDNGQRIFGRSRKYKRGVVGEFADTGSRLWAGRGRKDMLEK